MSPEEFMEIQNKVQDIMKRKERKKGELEALKMRMHEEFASASIEELESMNNKNRKLISKLKKEIYEDIEEFNSLYEKLLGHIEERN